MVLDKYKKMGGWLVIFLISTCYTIFRSLYSLIELRTVDPQIFAAPLIYSLPFILIIVQILGMVLASSYILRLIFQRHKYIPSRIQKVIIAEAIFAICTSIIFNLLLVYVNFISVNSAIATISRELLRCIIYTTIWVSYFKHSVRVSIYFNCIDLSEIQEQG